MILSASYKTDIPAFYGGWFLARLAAGDCRMVNSWGGQVYRVPLDRGSVDGIVFWTRNAGPFTAGFTEVARRGYPFTVQFTLTGYPRALEPSVPESEMAVAQIRRLAAEFGRRAVVWRYDPIVVTSLTPAAYHLETFSRLAAALRGAVDEVVISFAHFYRKTQRNLAKAAARHQFGWTDPALEEKRRLCIRLAEIAAEAGMTLTVCAQPEFTAAPAQPARCIDAARLSDVAGHVIAARRQGNRPGCLCDQSRDIGAYDTCPQGCVYCYAVADPARAQTNLRQHNPVSDMLAPPAPANMVGATTGSEP